MQDRVPLYPGRVTLTPVDGLTNTYDMVRADEPTQEGTPLNKATFLKDSTASLLGLPNTALPDDALKVLSVGLGYYGFRIKVLLSNGEPAEGVKIEGIMSLDGADIYTDYNGVAVGKSIESSVTISLISPFLDQKNPEPTVIESTGTITDTTISLLEQTDIIEITESKTAKCSQTITSADITVVGGGGGGGGGTNPAGSGGHSPKNAGGGGGGGYVTTSLGVSKLLLSELIIIIGAGGSAGGTINSVGQPGTDGGTTSIQLLNSNVITALGGSGGLGQNTSGSRGGAGNGNGGGYDSSASTTNSAGNGTGYIFNDSSLGLAGGGGGGSGATSTSYISGGTPYGGTGALRNNSTNSPSTAGTGFGGGGGGGIRTDDASNGAPGGVYLRFHF